MTTSAAVKWHLVLAASLLLGSGAQALPRYSARYEQNCALCHVNPSGGGMRSEYATRELIPKEFAIGQSATPMIDTHLGKYLTFGTDFRELYLASSQVAGGLSPQGFFPMQGDVYFALQLDPRYMLYYSHGLTNTYEAFGFAHVLPWDGYIKAGKFVPPYGWRFDDHTMYVRADEGFTPPAISDGGVEVGFAPKFGDLRVAVVNGSRGSQLDVDRRLSTIVNLSARFKVLKTSGSLGIAWLTQPGITEDQNNAGLFGYLTAWKLTWVGQADLLRTDPIRAPATTAFVTSHEWTALVRQGIELKGTYDFFDPDRSLASGARSRWGAGCAVMPRSFLVGEVLFRRTHVDRGPAITGVDYDEGVFQLHLLY